MSESVSMKKWLASKLEWARKNPLFWLNLMFLLFSAYLFFNNTYQSLGLRVWGTVLQLVGLTTVGLDLAGAARYHGRESLWISTKSWVREGFGRKDAITLKVEAGLSVTFAPGVALGTHGPESNSVEDRLKALEKNVEVAHSRITRIDTRFNNVSREIREDLRREGKARSEEIAKVKDSIRDAAIGNYAMLQFGGAWIGVGMFFTTFPDEILCFRRWMGFI